MIDSAKAWFIPGTVKLVFALGTTCTIGYGTLFYSFSLLSKEFEQAFGWQSEFIFGIYSLGILLGGVTAPIIGKALDRFGCRLPMAAGSFLMALGLLALATVQNAWQFTFALLFVEALSLLVLYESAFVALAHSAGKEARTPITQITLMAGFASTIFWPLLSWVLSWTDWRAAYCLMAALHVLICLPLHYFCIGNHSRIIEKSHAQKPTPPIQHDSKKEWVLALCLGASSFVVNGLQIHLFNIMGALNISLTLTLLAGTLVGPSQVTARLTDLLFGRFISPLALGYISHGCLLFGIALLLMYGLSQSSIALSLIILFPIVFGAGQGLSNIVRGALPLYIFNAEHYGTITGRLNGVRFVMTAIAPISFTLLMNYWGVKVSLVSLLLLLLASIVGFTSLKRL